MRRPSELIAFLIAGLAMLCVHDARMGDPVAVEAHAEEMTPLAAISELVKHKGLEVAPESACDGYAVERSFDSKEFAEEFTMVGVTVDRGDLAKVNPKYPKDYDASFVTLVGRHEQSTTLGQMDNLVMITTNVILCRTTRQNLSEYAFTVMADGQILKAAVGKRVGNSHKWSVVARHVGRIDLGNETPNEMTAEMRDIFSTELQLWSSAAMRHLVEKLPSKR